MSFRGGEFSTGTTGNFQPELTPLMDRGFAANCQLARTLPASHPVLVHRLASLLHASFRPHLTVRPLRFAITSPPSGCEEDLHLPAVEHARHTKKNGEGLVAFPVFCGGTSPEEVRSSRGDRTASARGLLPWSSQRRMSRVEWDQPQDRSVRLQRPDQRKPGG